MDANTVVAWILRSPLHGMLSGSVMLVTATGRKTGRTYTTPVNYTPDGDVLLTTSLRTRTWWRNARGGARVALRLCGNDRNAVCEVIEEEAAVAAAFRRYFELQPAMAKRLGVARGPDGRLNNDDLAKVARERVVVRFTPTSA